MERVTNLSDMVVGLESFIGSERETNPLYKDYHGKFHLQQCKKSALSVSRALNGLPSNWVSAIKQHLVSFQNIPLKCFPLLTSLEFGNFSVKCIKAAKETWQLLACCQAVLLRHGSIRCTSQQAGFGEFTCRGGLAII